jgi:hypothetical protein
MTALSSRTKLGIGQRLITLIILGFCLFLLPGGLFAQSQTVALDDSAITPPNTAVTINVVTNDTPGSGTLNLATITNTTSPANGTVAKNSDGTFTYTPNPNFSSPDPDTFDYTVCDTATPTPSCDSAVVSVIVAIEVPFNVIPKKLNVKKMGVLPVVVFGSADLDVTMIDPASIRLEGVPPIRSNVGGKMLTLKFRAQDIVEAIGEVNDGEVVILQLTGNLNEDAGGDAIIGEDTVLIIKKGKPKPSKK